MQWLFVAELIFSILIFFGKNGESLNCYVCVSDEGDGCNGNMNESYSVKCPEKPGYEKPYCRKIHQTLKIGKDKTTLIRECAYETGDSGCYTYKIPDVVKQKICECEEDLCNTGNSLKSSISNIFATFCALSLTYLVI